MKEFVKMYEMEKTDRKGCHLISECLSRDEAREFAEVFENNYGGKVIVASASRENDYVVFADDIFPRLISANYRPKEQHYIFATHKYIDREHGRKKR